MHQIRQDRAHVADDNFYPRDAMLARVLAMALCLSVWHKSVFY